MSDPAVDAAYRAWPHMDKVSDRLMIAAAREALKPIRVLHRRMGSGSCWSCVDIHGGNQQWPCDTARLVYSTEELES